MKSRRMCLPQEQRGLQERVERLVSAMHTDMIELPVCEGLTPVSFHSLRCHPTVGTQTHRRQVTLCIFRPRRPGANNGLALVCKVIDQVWQDDFPPT